MELVSLNESSVSIFSFAKNIPKPSLQKIAHLRKWVHAKYRSSFVSQKLIPAKIPPLR